MEASNYAVQPIVPYLLEIALDDTVQLNNKVYYEFEFIGTTNILVREDTALRQVYAYNPAGGIEYVIFDFSLSIGDTLPSNFSEVNDLDNVFPLNTAIIFSIDSVYMADGTPRKRYKANSSTQGLVIMIEGLGGPKGFISPNDAFGETHYSLYYVKENNAIIYGEEYNYSIPEEENGLEIYPNPISNQCMVASEQPIQIYINNNLGEIVYQSVGVNMQHQIDFSAYDSGIYFVKGFNVNNVQVFVNKVVKE